jgi:hypothetical protein
MKDGGITRREGWWWDGSGKCGFSGAIRGRVLAVAATEKFPELLRPCVRPRALRVPRLALPLSCTSCCRRLLHVLTTRSCSRVLNATALYMWRSNVLGLRNCSSARPIHHRLRVRCYSSAGLPVSNGEFKAVLNDLLKDKWASKINTPIGMQLYAPRGSD